MTLHPGFTLASTGRAAKTSPIMATNGSRATSEEVALRKDMSGGVLLSHSLSVAVPSALKGLTSGFGMGPGISPSLWPP